MNFNSDFVQYFILILITFAVVFLLSFVARRLLNYLIKRSSEDLHADPTNFIFLKNSISYIIYAFGLFWIFHKIPYFNALGTAMFAGAGVLAAVIGFASQKAFSNIIGGLFILIFKPFRVGDTIEISNARKGIVEEITLRHTIIKNYEFRRVVIPNSVISEETIINSSITDDKIRKQINIGISYESNIDKAISIIKEVISNHQLHIDNRTKEELAEGYDSVVVKLVSLSDYSVILRAYVWTNNNDDAFVLECDSLYLIKQKFDLHSIEIPYPHRTIVHKDKVVKISNER